ncbi:MAG TPA: alpha/beta hydrolase [Vicinamibacterales bacterium]|nr:alpha/beta hydrolase [Vicinamibacterales bacterium]
MSAATYAEEAGAGPPVLAIHGLGGGAHFFGGFARRLQPHYRVLSIDLPGTGRSGAGDPLSMKRWVDDLGALVADRIGEPAFILGHSMGTIVALKAWRAWPELVRGLVFVGGLPEARAIVRERLSPRLEALRNASTLHGWGPKVAPANFSRSTMREQPEIVALFERLFEEQPVEIYRRSCRLLLESSAADVVHDVDAPCLAVTGADDQYAPPEDVAAFVSRMARPAQLVVLPDCGHLPFLEQPAAFAAAVMAFMRSC